MVLRVHVIDDWATSLFLCIEPYFFFVHWDISCFCVCDGYLIEKILNFEFHIWWENHVESGGRFSLFLWLLSIITPPQYFGWEGIGSGFVFIVIALTKISGWLINQLAKLQVLYENFLCCLGSSIVFRPLQMPVWSLASHLWFA